MTPELINLAARLVAEIGDRAEREARIAAAAWRAGYQAGFAAGEDVGHGRAHAEIERDWNRLAEKIRAMANRPSFAELQKIRYQPNGDREYTGGPVQWDAPEGGAA